MHNDNHTPTTESRPTVGVVLYPFATAIDFLNPQTALAFFCDVHLLWKDRDPLPMDSGFSVVPTMTFDDCPDPLDVLLVPGGMGTNDAMTDPMILDFLRIHGKIARYVTSVCTGSLVLGAAGLLDGYKAATHWAFYEALGAMNVEASTERVVVDRNRITGGGVTAGLDFGLTVLAELRDSSTAELAQLLLEYDPAPPFDSGHPRCATSETRAAAEAIMGESSQQAVELARASLNPRMPTA